MNIRKLLLIAAASSTALAGAQAADGSSALVVDAKIRAWIGTVDYTWQHDASSLNPAFGNPTSLLDWQDIPFMGPELDLDVYSVETGLSARGRLGLGLEMGKSRFDDWDYLAGGTAFSYTQSNAKLDNSFHGIFDLGTELPGLSTDAYRVNAFAGYFGGSYQLEANGVDCLISLDATGANQCAGGIPIIGDNVKAIGHDLTIHAMRLGLSGHIDVTDRLRLAFDGAYLPWMSFKTEDNHYLRTDLGPLPNIVSDASGQAFQVQAGASYRVGNATSLNLDLRYWRFNVDGDVVFAPGTANPAPPLPQSSKLGVVAVGFGLSHKF